MPLLVRSLAMKTLQVLTRKWDNGPPTDVAVTTSDERMNKWIRRPQSDLTNRHGASQDWKQSLYPNHAT